MHFLYKKNKQTNNKDKNYTDFIILFKNEFALNYFFNLNEQVDGQLTISDFARAEQYNRFLITRKNILLNHTGLQVNMK